MSSRCSSCGAYVKWIKMTSGKYMPVDDVPIRYIHAPHRGDMVFVTERGTVERGFVAKEDESVIPVSVGYQSHFATCPNADSHRKR